MRHRKRDPLAETLRQRLITARHLGLMQPGDRLPSTRRLAAEFDTTQRVVMSAIRQLAQQGLVDFRTRSGVYLAGGDDSSQPVPDWATERALPLLREAIIRGSPAAAVVDHLRVLLETSRPRVACVECNDDHSDALCRELERDYGFGTAPLLVEELATPRAKRVLARTDALITTVYHQSQAQHAADQAGLPLLTVQLRRDLMVEIGRLMERGNVFFIGTDLRFERKLKSMFSGTDSIRRLRVRILGRDDPKRIPDAAPVYIMERAWERLRGWARRESVAPIRRLIDDESIEPLLQLFFAHNLAHATLPPSAKRSSAKRSSAKRSSAKGSNAARSRAKRSAAASPH